MFACEKLLLRYFIFTFLTCSWCFQSGDINFWPFQNCVGIPKCCEGQKTIISCFHRWGCAKVCTYFLQCQEIEKAAFSLDLSSTPFIIFFVNTAFDQVPGTCPCERVGQKRCAEYCCYWFCCVCHDFSSKHGNYEIWPLFHFHWRCGSLYDV